MLIYLIWDLVKVADVPNPKILWKTLVEMIQVDPPSSNSDYERQ